MCIIIALTSKAASRQLKKSVIVLAFLYIFGPWTSLILHQSTIQESQDLPPCYHCYRIINIKVNITRLTGYRYSFPSALHYFPYPPPHEAYRLVPSLHTFTSHIFHSSGRSKFNPIQSANHLAHAGRRHDNKLFYVGWQASCWWWCRSIWTCHVHKPIGKPAARQSVGFNCPRSRQLITP